jgi:cupin fold WbuC family metalloprotein
MRSTVVSLGDAEVVVITEKQIRDLQELALQAPLKRARYCLHHSVEDSVHEMIIALARDVYIRPHRHHYKCESFHVLEGSLEVVFFDDAGAVTGRIRLAANGVWGTRIYRMNKPLWHCVLVHSEIAVIHETTQGPFVQNDCDYAAWAPDGSDPEAERAFVEKLLKQANASPNGDHTIGVQSDRQYASVKAG